MRVAQARGAVDGPAWGKEGERGGGQRAWGEGEVGVKGARSRVSKVLFQ